MAFRARRRMILSVSAAPVHAPAAPKLLLYDGECPFCSGVGRLTERAGLLPAGGALAFQDAEPALAERLRAAGIANEVLVLERATGELRSGARGLAWLLAGTRLAPLARLVARPPLREALDALYGFVASNRRFLAAPRPRGPTCACEPDDRPARRRLFTGLAVLLAALPLLLLGWCAPRADYLGHLERLGAWAPLFAAGAPWCVPALCALALPRAARGRYLAHLAATAAAGGLALLPIPLLVLAAPHAGRAALPALLPLGAALAGGLMFAMQRRRLAYQGLGARWLWTWTACAALGLAALLLW
jgi:predicted DCC family thiol-disulfide oxidoreductase YuxK